MTAPDRAEKGSVIIRRSPKQLGMAQEPSSSAARLGLDSGRGRLKVWSVIPTLYLIVRGNSLRLFPRLERALFWHQLYRGQATSVPES
jgi:hypothetical protein